MSSFEEVKIIGFDPERPPIMRKESYIDLFFKLSQTAPLDWCEEFNALGRRINPSAKIDKNTRDCIDTYINDMDKISSHLNAIKQTVIECNAKHMEKIHQKELALAANNAAVKGQGGEQHRLNQIISGIKFDT